MTERIEEQIRRYTATVDEMAPEVEALLPTGVAEELGVEPAVVEVMIPLRQEKSRSRMPGWVIGVAAAAAVLILALPLWLSLLIQQEEDVVATTQPGPITTIPSVDVPGLVRNPDNGHFYQAVVNESDSITWDEARSRAAALSLEGFPGHLATITSEQEGLFIRDTFSEFLDSGPWIGGFQIEGSAEPDAGWRWVTGEPFDYDNWGEVEPNNDGDEACIQIFDGSPPVWNDFPCAAGEGAVFLVEFDVPLGNATNYNVDVGASFEAEIQSEPALVSVEGHGNGATDWPTILDLFIEVQTVDGSYRCSYTNPEQPFADDGVVLTIEFDGSSDCGTEWDGRLVVRYDGAPVEESSVASGLRVDDQGVQDQMASIMLQVTEDGSEGDVTLQVEVTGVAFYQAIVERFFNAGD